MKSYALIISFTMLVCMTSCNNRKTESGKSSDISQPTIQNSTNKDEEKTNITIALAMSPETWNGWNSVMIRAKELSKGDSPYNIEIKLYEFSEDDRYGDSSISELSMDILSGNAPDIIAASPFQLQKFSKNGYLADLSQLMDSGVGMKREEFLDNVIESVKTDNGINVVYPAFKINTAAAKNEFVGADSRNWTVNQAIDAYNSFDGDFLANNFTKYDIRHYFFYGVMMDCIDCRTHTCDFNKGLINVLDFLTGLPQIEKRFDDPNIGQIGNNTALVKELQINGINSSYAVNVLMNFYNEPMTFVGYPTDSGKGSYADIMTGFGIMTYCEQKEKVWEALSMLIFDSEFQTMINNHFYGIPVKKSVIESLFLSAKNDNASSVTVSEENEKKSTDISINAPYEFPDGTELRLTEKQKQQLSDLIYNIEIDPFVNRMMEYIIKEESDYFFEGERTKSECIDILQNRIGIYLSENQ